MTPKSFDIDTCKEFIGDAGTRTIEAKARKDAEAGVYEPPAEGTGSHMSKVRSEMEYRIYVYAHHKRLERLARMATSEASPL